MVEFNAESIAKPDDGIRLERIVGVPLFQKRNSSGGELLFERIRERAAKFVWGVQIHSGKSSEAIHRSNIIRN